jgi:hypothetical protein
MMMMKLTATNPWFNAFVQYRPLNWRKLAGGLSWFRRRDAVMPEAMDFPGPVQPRNLYPLPEMGVTHLEVTFDTDFMVCTGTVRNSSRRPQSNVIVAVEWQNEQRRILRADWERVTKPRSRKAITVGPGEEASFVVKARLDHRVRWLRAYTFYCPP